MSILERTGGEIYGSTSFGQSKCDALPNPRLAPLTRATLSVIFMYLSQVKWHVFQDSCIADILLTQEGLSIGFFVVMS